MPTDLRLRGSCCGPAVTGIEPMLLDEARRSLTWLDTCLKSRDGEEGGKMCGDTSSLPSLGLFETEGLGLATEESAEES